MKQTNILYTPKKFKRSSYDLSHYYEGVQCLPTDSEEIELSKHAGLYGLEKLYMEVNHGGIKKGKRVFIKYNPII